MIRPLGIDLVRQITHIVIIVSIHTLMGACKACQSLGDPSAGEDIIFGPGCRSRVSISVVILNC